DDDINNTFTCDHLLYNRLSDDCLQGAYLATSLVAPSRLLRGHPPVGWGLRHADILCRLRRHILCRAASGCRGGVCAVQGGKLIARPTAQANCGARSRRSCVIACHV
ncbi:unnamed protein product, partial [Polarella glacialis]